MGQGQPKFFCSINQNMVGLDKDLKEVGKFTLPNNCTQMHKAILMNESIFVLFCKNVTLWQYKNDQLQLYHFETVQSGQLIHGHKLNDDMFIYVSDADLVVFSVSQKKAVLTIPAPRNELVIDDDKFCVWTANKELIVYNFKGQQLAKSMINEFSSSDKLIMKHWSMWDQNRVAIYYNDKIWFYNCQNLEFVQHCEAQGLTDFFFVRKYFIGFTKSELILIDMENCHHSSDILTIGKKFSLPEPPAHSPFVTHQVFSSDKKKRIFFALPYFVGLLDIENGVLESSYKVSFNDEKQTNIMSASYYGEKKLWIQQQTVQQKDASSDVKLVKQWLIVDFKDDKAKIVMNKEDCVMTGGVVRVEDKSLRQCQ